MPSLIRFYSWNDSFLCAWSTNWPLLFLQLWLLNGDSVVASVLEKCIGEERSISSPALHSPPPRAVRALKLLYITCSDADIQQREWVRTPSTSSAPFPNLILSSHQGTHSISTRLCSVQMMSDTFVSGQVCTRLPAWLFESSINLQICILSNRSKSVA